MRLVLTTLVITGTACGSVAAVPDAGASDAAWRDVLPDDAALTCHDPGVHDTLFAVSYSAPEVEIFDCVAELADGHVGGTRTLAGASTGLSTGDYEAVAVDQARDELYVADFGAQTIRVWANASTVDGDVAPDRTLTGALGTALALDTTRDRLYATAGPQLVVLAGVHLADGAVTPVASLSTADDLQQVTLDEAADRLYVSGIDAVYVFDHASALAGTGAMAPDRTMTLTETRGVSIDPARDTLYVGGRVAAGAVYAVAGAHTASGPVTPARTIVANPPGVPMDQVEQVQVADDRLFVYNDGASVVWIYDPASAADGAATPVKTLGFGLNAGTVAGGLYVP